MRKPEYYPDGEYHVKYGYKNPALRKINGVLTGYCCICQTYIGNEHDTNWYRLIKQEYCPACRDKVQLEQNADRQKKFRRNRKAERKLEQQRTHLLKEENRLLREMVIALRDDLDQLKCCQLKREDPVGE